MLCVHRRGKNKLFWTLLVKLIFFKLMRIDTILRPFFLLININTKYHQFTLLLDRNLHYKAQFFFSLSLCVCVCVCVCVSVSLCARVCVCFNSSNTIARTNNKLSTIDHLTVGERYDGVRDVMNI